MYYTLYLQDTSKQLAQMQKIIQQAKGKQANGKQIQDAKSAVKEAANQPNTTRIHSPPHIQDPKHSGSLSLMPGPSFYIYPPLSHYTLAPYSTPSPASLGPTYNVQRSAEAPGAGRKNVGPATVISIAKDSTNVIVLTQMLVNDIHSLCCIIVRADGERRRSPASLGPTYNEALQNMAIVHGRCRICCCELGSSQVYRIFSSLNVLTSVGQLLLEITQTPLDSEKDSDPKLCRSCYQEVNTLWKHNFAVNRSKEDLKARMSRAEVFFARRKRCRDPSSVSSPRTTPSKGTRTPPSKQLLKDNSPTLPTPRSTTLSQGDCWIFLLQ